jgi:hypothetical protein
MTVAYFRLSISQSVEIERDLLQVQNAQCYLDLIIKNKVASSANVLHCRACVFANMQHHIYKCEFIAPCSLSTFV